MSRSQLPLNALRAFEAAARHASFTHAAEELHVTQAAVSHQVKALEERLGVALFVRRPRGLEITSEGEALLPDLRDAFDRMTNALERVGRKANSGTLNVSLPPPRLLTRSCARASPRLQSSTARNTVFVSGIRMGYSNNCAIGRWITDLDRARPGPPARRRRRPGRSAGTRL